MIDSAIGSAQRVRSRKNAGSLIEEKEAFLKKERFFVVFMTKKELIGGWPMSKGVKK